MLFVAIAVLVLTSSSAQEQQQCSVAGLVPGNGATACMEGYTLCSGQCLRCPSSYTVNEQLGKCVPPCDAIIKFPSPDASENPSFDGFDRIGQFNCPILGCRAVAGTARFPKLPCSETCLQPATVGKIYPPGGQEAKQTFTLRQLTFGFFGLSGEFNRDFADANVTIIGFAAQKSTDGTGTPPQYQPLAVFNKQISLLSSRPMVSVSTTELAAFTQLAYVELQVGFSKADIIYGQYSLLIMSMSYSLCS